MKQDGTAGFVGGHADVRLLPLLLSVAAGSVDVIGFLGLGGLFIAHITGNLVVLAARSVAGGDASVTHLLSVPVFVTVLALARLLAAGLIRLRIATLRPLLLLQFLLLLGFLAVCTAAGPAADPNTALMIFAAMLGVSAMAVQNALVQISLAGSPSTAVMTTNLTRFVTDIGEVLFGAEAGDRAKAASRAWRTGAAIAGFIVGCGLGAWCQAHFGPWSLVLPTGVALATLAITYI